MKIKNFKHYLEQRLNKDEIAELEKQADSEFESFKLLQKEVSNAVEQYMQQKQIGFNELVRRLGVSATQVSKIQMGEANLTLASLAHISALLGKQPRLSFGATH